MRRAEQVQMVGHQHVIADQPRLCLVPDGQQVFMCIGICEPGHALISANRQKDNCGLADVDTNTGGRTTASLHVHSANLREGERPREPENMREDAARGRASVLASQMITSVLASQMNNEVPASQMITRFPRAELSHAKNPRKPIMNQGLARTLALPAARPPGR